MKSSLRSTLGTVVLGVGGVVLGGVLATSFSANAASTDTSGSTGGYGAPANGQADRGPSVDTPVTGSEAATVKKAVEAKYSDMTVTSVRKDPDGTYDALGTQNGDQVMADVSTDLQTITLNAGFGGRDHDGDGQAAPSGEAPAA